MREERGSPTDVVAGAAVAAKAEREAMEAELQRTPGWRFRRKAAVEQALEDALARERGLVSTLGGKDRDWRE